ncbi:MAG: S8 family serine peptidase [Nostoc sp.]|uniref:S8 family serine peptidase n=1 Tax=Nostoc sp. TaxID=1180 RepID=UPI002FF6EE70
MSMDYMSNNSLSNNGLNINSLPSYNYLNLNNNYDLNFNSYSSFNQGTSYLETDTNQNQQFTTTSLSTSGTYNPISGYGLIDAASAVAQAAGQNTFSDVPNLGANNWGDNLVKAPEAWAKGYTGKGVVVAVLDTGVDYNDTQLQNNIWTNPNNDAAQGYANDVHGWNFVDNNNNVLDTSTIGHGTHVSGIIAGENNGSGITGVAYDAKIMAIKVLDNSGAGSDTSITEGIYYAVDHGANVINLSLGGAYPNMALESAIQYASSKNVVVVMAAGNDSADTPDYPASYAKNWGLTVGAVDQNNNIADFSNRAGSDPLAYVTAPGVNISSTIPGNQYATYSGTSMATPFVAGVVALMLSANHNLTDGEVRQIVTQTAQHSTQTTTSEDIASPTLNSMIASTSFSSQLVAEKMIEISSSEVMSIINSMVTSPIIGSNNILINSDIRSQSLSNDQKTFDDSSSNDNTDAENINLLELYQNNKTTSLRRQAKLV